MTIAEWVKAAEGALRRAGCEAPRLEAEAILAHAAGLTRAALLTRTEDGIPEPAATATLERRLTGEPLAYVLGRKEFFGREFIVNRSVFIPRPETETVVESMLERLKAGMACLDVGTGCGAIALTLALERPGCRWTAGDISRQALTVAALNAKALGAAVRFVHADRLTCFRNGSLDAVVSNPPYVDPDDPRLEKSVRDWEPPVAFRAPGGVSFIRHLVKGACRALRPAGLLVFEFGIGQAHEVAAMLRPDYDFEIRADLSGIPRVAVATLQRNAAG